MNISTYASVNIFKIKILSANNGFYFLVDFKTLKRSDKVVNDKTNLIPHITVFVFDLFTSILFYSALLREHSYVNSYGADCVDVLKSSITTK